jgi:sulfofructose kinase
MATFQFDVVGIGLNSVDLLCRVKEFPVFNTKSSLDDVSRQGGGQAATAMAALSRLEMKTAFIGVVGDDDDGFFSVSSLKAAGVNVEGIVVRPDLATQFSVIVVQSDGDDEERGGRTILWRREVILRSEDVREDIVKSARMIHIDGHSLEAEILAAQWAREEGIPVSFDAERVVPGVEELISLTDYLVASEGFPSAFSGSADPKVALKKIHSLGPRVAAMTKGPRGALAFDGERFYDSPGFPVNVVDTTGAGDVFHAGFIYGVLREFELSQTLRFANALAALSCRELGGRAGLCGLKEAKNLIAKFPDLKAE